MHERAKVLRRLSRYIGCGHAAQARTLLSAGDGGSERAAHHLPAQQPDLKG